MTEINNQPNNRKQDIYNKKVKFAIKYDKLCQSILFNIPENNQIIRKFIDAKWKGYYGSILYYLNEPESTLLKNLEMLCKIESIFNKPFTELIQTDIDNLQVALNCDKIHCHQSFKNNKPISHDYKLDIIKNIKQFWRFYIYYAEVEEKIVIPDIVKYLRVKKPKNQNHLIKFISKSEMESLIDSTISDQMKAFIAVFFETGARVIEILLLQKDNCIYDENKRAWIIRLPNEKGISYAKSSIELTFSSNHFAKWFALRKSHESVYVFDYTYDYARKKLGELSIKATGRRLTPKEFRKGMTMYLINNDVNEQYIKAHMGWSPDSKVLSKYINQKAIKRPDVLNSAIQKDFYSDIIKENEDLRCKQKMQEEQYNKLIDEMKRIREEQFALFGKMRDIDISNSKNILKAVFEEIKNKNDNQCIDAVPLNSSHALIGNNV